MPNIDSFNIVANANVLTALYPYLPCSSDNSIELVGNKLIFDVYYFYNKEVVNHIKKVSQNHPDEIIHFTFAPESYNYSKRERYLAQDGCFYFKNIMWEKGVKYNDSDNEPELFTVDSKKNQIKILNMVFNAWCEIDSYIVYLLLSCRSALCSALRAEFYPVLCLCSTLCTKCHD